jgi:RNA polymerase sigma-70 factor (ECF subfamily)
VTAPPTWQLEPYLPLLHQQARQIRLSHRLRRRLDAADLMQEALLKAHANWAAFQGTTEAEWLAWLQEILASTAIDQVRKARAKKRDVRWEQSLQDSQARSVARLGSVLVSREASPSQIAEQHELAEQVARALEQLPPAQREVVGLRDLSQRSTAEVAGRLGRTRKSVAGLLRRGRRRLRELLGHLH